MNSFTLPWRLIADVAAWQEMWQYRVWADAGSSVQAFGTTDTQAVSPLGGGRCGHLMDEVGFFCPLSYWWGGLLKAEAVVSDRGSRRCKCRCPVREEGLSWANMFFLLEKPTLDKMEVILACKQFQVSRLFSMCGTGKQIFRLLCVKIRNM